MSSPTILYPNVRNWRDLYKAALFETDKSKMAARIANAEEAIVARARQLFGTGDVEEEDEALDDALYALRALQSCLHLNTSAA